MATALPLTPTAPATTQSAAVTRRRTVLPAWLALLQTVAVCGIPTQVAVAVGLVLFTNLPVMVGNGTMPTLEFFAMLYLLDTALVALMIRVFLMLSGENSRDVFLGTRPAAGEIVRGLLLVPVMMASVSGLVLLLRYLAPWMHTVSTNPLEVYMRTPLEAAIFIVVVMMGGGVKEELQRAFILHRFEQKLGGANWGLFIFTGIFGLLHLYEGVDAAVAVGVLGLSWGLLYLRRRSVVMSIASHAAFDAAQVALAFYAGSLPTT